MHITLLILNSLAMIFTVWRITDLFVNDEKIVLKLKTTIVRKFPKLGYFLNCMRCMSVWAGVFAVTSFYFVPWLNYPLALSWLYMWQKDLHQDKTSYIPGSRKFLIQVSSDGNFAVNNELSPEELSKVFSRIFPPTSEQEKILVNNHSVN